MKKYLILIAFTTIIIPSVAFASWWNPISWFNNWSFSASTDTKTQILEKRIAELESKINANATTTISATSTPSVIATTTIATTTATTTPVVKKEVKKITPTIDNSAIIEARVKAQVEATLKAKADQDALVAKQKADAQAVIDAQNAANLTAQQAQAKAANVQYLTKVEIGEFISSLKSNIASTDKIQRDYNNQITSEIRPEMAEYPSNQSLQQAGQDLINEFNNNIVLMNKVDAESTKVINSMTPYLNSDASLTFDEAISLGKDLKYYNQQYDESQVKLKALLLSFINIHISALTNETARIKGLIDQANQVNQVNQTNITNSINNKQTQLNAVNQKIAALNAKYSQDMIALDTNNAGGGVTTAFSNAQKAAIDSKYRNDFNALQAEFQQIQYSN